MSGAAARTGVLEKQKINKYKKKEERGLYKKQTKRRVVKM